MRTRHARIIRRGIRTAYSDYLTAQQSRRATSFLTDSLLGLFTRQERESFLEGRAYNHALTVAPKVFATTSV